MSDVANYLKWYNVFNHKDHKEHKGRQGLFINVLVFLVGLVLVIVKEEVYATTFANRSSIKVYVFDIPLFFTRGIDLKSKKSSLSKAREKEVLVPLIDSHILMPLVGERDHNLKTIERELGISIGRDARGLLLTGLDSEVDLAQDLLLQLSELIARGEPLFQGDVERAIQMLSGNRKLRLDDLFRDQLRIAGRKHSIVPKTFKQKQYLEAIRMHDIVFGVGPAGTGKTYLAMAMAVSALLNKEVKRVVLCRPAVEAGEKLGFLPGDMAEKVNPYLRPLYDALHDMVDIDKAKEMIEKGLVEVAPLAFMRGRTLSNAFVILDEAQNTTAVQMKMFLTRLGHRSKCIVTGDPSQIDLPRGIESGLNDALHLLKKVPGIGFLFFSEADVIRHPLVAKIVAAYDSQKRSHDG
jgi:phosphate starvation-inducible PhoH-like protein